MPRFVVAGATGRVGSVVTHELVEAGFDVTGITRSEDHAASFSAAGVGAVVADLGDTRRLAETLDGASGFFVLLPEPMNAVDFHAERRRLTDAIVSAVRSTSVAHVVALSSLGAQFAEAMGPITDLHYFENALRATGKPVTAVRAATFQDNIALLIGAAKQAGVIPNLQPDREKAISMVATRDVGRISARIMAEPATSHRIVDILGPWYSPRQVAAILEAGLERPLQIIDIPPVDHVAALTRNGLPRTFAEAVAELQLAIAAGRIVAVGDRRETGSTTLEQTVRHLLSPSLSTL